MIYRVLHIVPSLDYVSGILNSIMNYYSFINKDKYQYDFIYFNESSIDYKSTIESLGGRYYHFENMFHYFCFKKQLKQFCKEHYGEYTIIHLHMPFLAIFFYNLKKEIKAKAFVLHAHSTKYGDTKITNIRNKIAYYLFFHKADCYFACSDISGSFLFGKNYRSNGYLMKNIIDVKAMMNTIPKKTAKKELHLENNYVIGHVGAFSKPKNHKFIIDIFVEIYKENHNSRLLLVGDGKLRHKIEQYAKNRGVYDFVIFVGAQTDTKKYYCAMDVFLFPSLFEGYAMSFIEAQLCNLPCVVSDCIVEEANIKKDTNVFLSIKDDAKVWAKYVLNAKYSEMSKELIQELELKEITEVNNLQNKYTSLIKG